MNYGDLCVLRRFSYPYSKVVNNLYWHSCFARLNNRIANRNSSCTFSAVCREWLVIKHAVTELGIFTFCIVVVKVDWFFKNKLVFLLAPCTAKNITLVAKSFSLNYNIRVLVVNCDCAFCSVKESSHCVISLAADRTENLSYYIIWEFKYRNCAVVNRPVGQNLVVAVCKGFCWVSCNPSKQIYCVARTAYNRMTFGSCSPTICPRYF